VQSSLNSVAIFRFREKVQPLIFAKRKTRSPKAIVLFDIDSTLLNGTKVYSATLTHLIRKFNRADLTALRYLLFRRPKGFLGSPAAKNSFLAPQHYRDALFEDVLPTLQKLKGKASLGIFSQGPGRLQRAKLYLSGIESYFSPELTFIFPPRKILKAKRILAQLPKTKIYFVDDRPGIAAALANHRVKVFLIRRQSKPVPQNGGIIRIRSLKEIIDFV